jgi:hypothetical protein
MIEDRLRTTDRMTLDRVGSDGSGVVSGPRSLSAAAADVPRNHREYRADGLRALLQAVRTLEVTDD